MLLILNIPMAGMMTLIVIENCGYSYPGYIVYILCFILSIQLLFFIDFFKYKKKSIPILSTMKIIGVICALMFILGLKVAMID